MVENQHVKALLQNIRETQNTAADEHAGTSLNATSTSTNRLQQQQQEIKHLKEKVIIRTRFNLYGEIPYLQELTGGFIYK